VSESRVLRRIFGPKVEEVAGGGAWKTVHNEDLHNLYTSTNIIGVIESRRMRWIGRVVRIEEMKNAYILAGKPEWKRPLGRPTRICEDNIRMDLKGLGWKGVDWIHLTQDKDQWRILVKTVVNLCVP
jgi:hypothetical protein